MKGESSEDSLKKFDRWIESYIRWTNLCLINAQPLAMPRQWDLLISTGGHDLHNIIKEAQVIITQADRVDTIPYRPAQPAVPAAAGNAAVEAIPEQLPVPEVPAVMPTTPESYGWKEAALNTLIYQCPDNVWRQKILTGLQ